MRDIKQVFGTFEWAVENANFISGCNHNCKYCYSKEMAIRFKRKTSLTWEKEDINTNQFKRKVKRVDGLIMFPSSHDITPISLSYSIDFLEKLLKAENKVLVVTKPHLIVINKICDTFPDYKRNIFFRFTIGSNKTETLKFWEPNAPSFEERRECLICAYNKGFSTSVSCEPMLDGNMEELVMELEPYVTDSIWIGKANFLIRRLKMNGITDKETFDRARELIYLQSDNNIRVLYEKLCVNNKIKWKESIKKIVKLEISTTKGMDR